MSAEKKNTRVLIIVALIGLTGTLGTAIIANWNELFSPPVVDTNPTGPASSESSTPEEEPVEPPLQSPREPGLYLVQNRERGDSLREDMFEVIPLPAGEPVPDRPIDFDRHVRGACLFADVDKDKPIEWYNIGSCPQ